MVTEEEAKPCISKTNKQTTPLLMPSPWLPITWATLRGEAAGATQEELGTDATFAKGTSCWQLF